MRFLLTRPREDSEKLARNLTRLGHSSLIDPLITIEPCGPGKINLSLYEAVLLTSANGARALARGLQRHLPHTKYMIRVARQLEQRETGHSYLS